MKFLIFTINFVKPKFHQFHEILMFRYYHPLAGARSNVMNNVIRVIGEYIPDVRSIDLSENKLPSLDHFSLFEENTSNLEILNLSNNRLNDIRELEKLQDLQQLKSLRLDNNPLGKNTVDEFSHF